MAAQTPGYGGTTDPDMVISSSLSPDITIALGDGADYSDQHSAIAVLLWNTNRPQMGVHTLSIKHSLQVIEATDIHTDPGCGRVMESDMILSNSLAWT